MRLPYRSKKFTFWVIFGIIVVTMLLFKCTELRPSCLFKDRSTAPAEFTSLMLRDEKYVTDDNHRVYSYNREMPLIFIGGVPRSGTTLMRAMLDAHPEVRCGQETRVIPRILQLRTHWLKSEKESLRLQEAGITKEVMNSAIAQFCLEIIAKHGEPAPRLCNKDPLTLKMGSYIIELFPNAKFLFMVRDGRATVHSIISRKVTITGFDLTSYRQCLQKWNHAIEIMHDQCKDIGKERCMMVYYEQLVLHPEEWMRKILKFLDVPWNNSVLHHEEFINKPNGVPLSKVERSSDQVIKPVNLEALSKWVGQMPDDVVRDMANLAPMLSVLGYDPYSNPPDYGKPDAWVQDNTYKLRANRMLWESKAKQVLQLLPQQDAKDETKSDEDNVAAVDAVAAVSLLNVNSDDNNNNNNDNNNNDAAAAAVKRSKNKNNNHNNNNNNNHKVIINNNQNEAPPSAVLLKPRRIPPEISHVSHQQDHLQHHSHQQKQQQQQHQQQHHYHHSNNNNNNNNHQQHQEHQEQQQRQRQHLDSTQQRRIKPKDIITIKQFNYNNNNNNKKKNNNNINQRHANDLRRDNVESNNNNNNNNDNNKNGANPSLNDDVDANTGEGVGVGVGVSIGMKAGMGVVDEGILET